MDKARKAIQACSCFLTLHTLAKNMKNYVPLDKKTGQPTSEEVRRLLFYAREIDRCDGRNFLRNMMVSPKKKKR